MSLNFKHEDSKSQIQEIEEYILEFIDKSKTKKYFSNENIYENLKKLVIKNFGDRCSTYGDFQTDGNESIRLNLNLSKGFIPEYIGLKHIVFHELSHAITPTIGGDGGKYGILPPPKPKISLPSDKTLITINNYAPTVEPIFNEVAKTFFREIIAKATACDLADDYLYVPTIVDGVGFSDWLVPLNRRYQALGDDFLKTISKNCKDDKYSARERFKELTLEAMKPDNTIVEDIMHIYAKKCPETWKEDIHTITSIFSDVYVSKDFSRVDTFKVSIARKTLQKYLPQIVIPDVTPKITIKNRNDNENAR